MILGSRKDNPRSLIWTLGTIQIKSLCLVNSPFQDQQLTDDGFDELIAAQEKFLTLRELDIKDCFSHSLSARTVLSLHRVTSLTSLHLR